jgi:hypothetical protein
MMIRQQEDKENNPNRSRFKGKNDYSGTFKIGGENREIKVKNYDEISNNLVLNPTREVITNEARGRSQIENRDARMMQRGKSQGYNIINHSNAENYSHANNMYSHNNNQGQNVMPPSNQRQVQGQVPGQGQGYGNPQSRVNTENQYSQGRDMINMMKPPQQPQLPQQVQQHEPESYGNYPYNDNSNPAEQFDDPEFQKYYEEYLRQKLREEEEGLKQMQQPINKYPQDQAYQGEIPTGLDEYEAYRNQKLNDEINNYNNQALPNYVRKIIFLICNLHLEC